MEKRLINKTTYTKGFYISLTLYKIKRSLLSIVGGFSIVVTITQGIGMMRDQPVTGWWTVFAGAVAMPLIVYVVPFIINMKNYKKIVKDNKGEDIVVSLELTDSKIICRNSMGQTQHCRYKDVKEVVDKSNMFVVSFNNNGAPVYLSNTDEAFIGCTKKEVIERFEKFSGVKVQY